MVCRVKPLVLDCRRQVSLDFNTTGLGALEATRYRAGNWSQQNDKISMAFAYFLRAIPLVVALPTQTAGRMWRLIMGSTALSEIGS